VPPDRNWSPGGVGADATRRPAFPSPLSRNTSPGTLLQEHFSRNTSPAIPLASPPFAAARRCSPWPASTRARRQARNFAAGELEMQSSADAIGMYRTVLLAWATGDLAAVMPGGTSGHEFLAAFDESVRGIADAIEDRALTAVAVSHAAAIRTWAAVRCQNVDPAAISGRALANTDALIVEGSADSGWRLAAWLDEANDTTWGALRDPTGWPRLPAPCPLRSSPGCFPTSPPPLSPMAASTSRCAPWTTSRGAPDQHPEAASPQRLRHRSSKQIPSGPCRLRFFNGCAD
jgi:broad specificity phosphatase PhoE